MRPRRIEMEGFGTFVAPTSLDVDDVDLVAFVGPTGSGKSTVIDAMTFALYGSVARYDDARLVAPVISQTANEARVRLDFEAGDAAYTVVRVVRRTKTGASTKEARLERHGTDDGGEPGGDVLASGAKEVTEAVEALLGLDFTQFTRTVVLPQGEFAKFLKDDPSSRQKLLSRLLDLGLYGRMGARARDVAKEAGIEAGLLGDQLAASAEVSADALTAARSRLDALVEFEAGVGTHLAGIDSLEAELVEMRARRAELDARVRSLGAIARPDGVADLTRRASDAREAAARAEATLAEARTARDAAEAAIAEAGEVAAHQSLLDRLVRLGEVRTAIDATAAQVEALREPIAAAEADLAAADEAAEAASAALDRARAHADAAQWTAQLTVGEPCPVCHQDVAALPDHDADAALSSARAAADAAAAALASARTTHAGLVRDAEVAAARLAERTAEEAKLAATVPADTDAAAVSAALEAAKAAAETGRTATASVREAEAGAAQAARAVAAVADDESAARRELGTARDSVAALGPPAPEGESLLADWDALVAWSEARQVDERAALDALTEEGKAVRARQEELRAAFAATAAPFGFDADKLRSDARGVVAGVVAEARAEVASIERRLTERADVEKRQKVAEKRQAVHRELGNLLKANGFEQWLLSEAVADLVDRATGQLYALSGGQFSLAATDTSFEIVDHRNADATRDVRTLSGGETFLASLALALALADSIAELAPVDTPRLESMFLDEGFGTLDPETLDLVAAAIEELSAGGRLVGIVTHIEALAERMPVRFVVRKDPATSVLTKVVS